MGIRQDLSLYSDKEIANAILSRDTFVTKEYLYIKCYPLFKSIYDNYYTDCCNCKEFIDEIYLLVLQPSKATGKCQIENFKGESTLASWFKSVCLFYCYNKYNLKKRMPEYERLSVSSNPESENRLDALLGSTNIDFSALNRDDAMTIIGQMPNKRYQKIIQLRYVEDKSNEETAEILGMSMDNYYNKHKLAKAQYIQTLRKEEVKNA